MIRIERFLVKTPFDAWPGLGTQPCYKAPDDLRLKMDKNAVINIELLRLFPSWLRGSQVAV